jgi:N-acetylmuramoyl-L-alanine amidase
MAKNSPFPVKQRLSYRSGIFAVLTAVWFLLVGPVSALTFSRVVIDAGHGGVDGGTVWNGLIERNLTLDVAKRVESLLKARGVGTAMTRRSNVTVSLDSRARIANRYTSAVFVSIHFNADRNRSVTGFETFYRSSRGRALAGAVQRSLDQKVTGRSRGIRYRDYSVLRGTMMPAILIECGFISNKSEAARCGSSSHRQKLAEAIAEGIIAARG